ncbi:MAG TPA: DUF4239 domain-containing protein [Burkholderiales bacterium]|nr:DUF4239 domain-containing protein [Burkholderiales bacterium]
MNFTLTAMLLAGGLFVGMLFCLEIGRRIGVRRAALEGEAARAGAGVVDGAVFALLGLLIAFTFSGAATRFDERRKLIIEEANDIGTAYLRIDLLPAAAQGELRESFRRYLDARLAAYRAAPDIDAAKAGLARAAALQQEIWAKAVAASTGSQAATMLLLPAINQMIDITTMRTMATQSHPPLVLFALLFALALLGALLAGHAMAGARKRDWMHMATFAFALAGAVYVILDIEYPRLGLIRLDAFDQVLVDVRQSMK